MATKKKKILLGIPRGSLQEYTLKVFRGAGFDLMIPERGYALQIDDPELGCFLLRPQEIPKYVEEGKLDAGITGDDCILEAKAKVVEVCDLKYAKQKIKKARWVLAVPKNSKINSVKDLAGKLISTEMVELARAYLKKNKVKARVEFSWGTTEVKPPRFADAIIDLTETGESLRAHNLKIIDTVLESSTKLIANKSAWQNNWKKEKIEGLALLLQGAVESEEIANLTMHAPAAKLNHLLKLLPKLKKPTLRKLAGEDWYDVRTTCKTKEARVLIPCLKRLGCKELIQYPIKKLIP